VGQIQISQNPSDEVDQHDGTSGTLFGRPVQATPVDKVTGVEAGEGGDADADDDLMALQDEQVTASQGWGRGSDLQASLHSIIMIHERRCRRVFQLH
jgi:hypothetical protein